MSEQVEAVAQKAYDTLTVSLQSGEWAEFFDLFGPEVDVILPAPVSSGRFTGTEGRAQLVETFSRFTPGLVRFDTVELIGKTVGADRVVFEDRATGEAFGEPYDARHCLHFIVRDGKVVGFHEYNRPV